MAGDPTSVAQRQLAAARVFYTNHHTNQRATSGVAPRLRTALSAACAALLLGSSAALAHDTKEMLSKSVIEPTQPLQGAKVNLLLGTQFADKYVTPRGMIVRDEGLTIQPLLLAFLTLYEGDGWLSHFKFVGGVWNDFGSAGVSENAPFGSDPKTNWTEIDPIFGLSFGFKKVATLNVTYTAFVERILDIPTAHNLEVKLILDDSKLLGPFALNPYFLFWKELEGKTTAARVPYAVFGPSPFTGSASAPGEGYYFEIGVAPSYTFKGLGDLKLEAPCRVMLPSENFYGEWYDSASTVGLYELGVKASLPLKFMPKGYGSWTVNTGYRYQSFVDNNLKGMNQFNAPGKPVDEIHQVYGGISVFF